MKDTFANNITVIKRLASMKITHKYLADKLGISTKSLYNKLHDRNEFTTNEISLLSKYTGLVFEFKGGRLQIW